MMASVIIRKNIVNKILSNYSLVSKRISTSKAPDAVFLEKSLEEPVLVIAEEDNVDIIGPPDPVSNLRPIIRKRVLNETCIQQRLREMQDATQAWNQKFWTEHNTNFIKEREAYIQSRQIPGQEKRTLTAEEMSEFYKIFLDNNWETHFRYNMEWYKKNFTLLFLALRVQIEKHLAKLL